MTEKQLKELCGKMLTDVVVNKNIPESHIIFTFNGNIKIKINELGAGDVTNELERLLRIALTWKTTYTDDLITSISEISNAVSKVTDNLACLKLIPEDNYYILQLHYESSPPKNLYGFSFQNSYPIFLFELGTTFILENYFSKNELEEGLKKRLLSAESFLVKTIVFLQRETHVKNL